MGQSADLGDARCPDGEQELPGLEQGWRTKFMADPMRMWGQA